MTSPTPATVRLTLRPNRPEAFADLAAFSAREAGLRAHRYACETLGGTEAAGRISGGDDRSMRSAERMGATLARRHRRKDAPDHPVCLRPTAEGVR